MLSSQIWQKPESCQRIRWNAASAGLMAANAVTGMPAGAARRGRRRMDGSPDEQRGSAMQFAEARGFDARIWVKYSDPSARFKAAGRAFARPVSASGARLLDSANRDSIRVAR